MAKSKKYIKKKSSEIFGQNAAGPGYRTRSDFKVKASLFSGGVRNVQNTRQSGFNPSTFKIQHKG